MKLCESCGESEVLWLDTTSGDPEPEPQVLCLSCFEQYIWTATCQGCGEYRWTGVEYRCWGCSQPEPINDDTPFGRFCTELVDKVSESFADAVDFWSNSCYNNVDELAKGRRVGNYSEKAALGWRIAMSFCYVAYQAKEKSDGCY
jgi:hypothetical protein